MDRLLEIVVSFIIGVLSSGAVAYLAYRILRHKVRRILARGFKILGTRETRESLDQMSRQCAELCDAIREHRITTPNDPLARLRTLLTELEAAVANVVEIVKPSTAEITRRIATFDPNAHAPLRQVAHMPEVRAKTRELTDAIEELNLAMAGHGYVELLDRIREIDSMTQRVRDSMHTSETSILSTLDEFSKHA